MVYLNTSNDILGIKIFYGVNASTILLFFATSHLFLIKTLIFFNGISTANASFYCLTNVDISNKK